MPSTVPALELRSIHKRFGQNEVLCGASLAVQRGERVALIGPNGAGKSTLFNVVSGRFAPDGGEVRLNGQAIHGLRSFEINRMGLARSFQITNIFPRLSVFENLRCSVLWQLGYGYAMFRLLARLKDANHKAAEVMARIGLESQRDRPAEELTYAEQRALEVGITIAGDAPVILLDEPTAGMNRAEAARFVRLIREVTQDRSLLMVEHDMGVVFDLADKVAVLVQGQVIALDTPEAIRRNAQVQVAYLGSEGG